MGRKSKPKEVPTAGLPEYITSSRTIQRKKVTKRALPNYTEAMLLLHAPEVQRQFWAGMVDGLKRGDKEFFRMTGEMFDLLKKGGINIVQQNMMQNVAAGDQAPVKGYDAFVRELSAARDEQAALPEPQPVIDIRPADTVPVGG